MTILSEESRALLKRMDADDAIEAAALAGWNAALHEIERACAKRAEGPAHDDWDDGYISASASIQRLACALKEQK